MLESFCFRLVFRFGDSHARSEALLKGDGYATVSIVPGLSLMRDGLSSLAQDSAEYLSDTAVSAGLHLHGARDSPDGMPYSPTAC